MKVHTSFLTEESSSTEGGLELGLDGIPKTRGGFLCGFRARTGREERCLSSDRTMEVEKKLLDTLEEAGRVLG